MWTPTKTYVDTVHGVSFAYPSAWKRGASRRNDSMDGPSLFNSRITVEASFDSQSTGHYAADTLEAVYFTYAHEPEASDAACDALAATLVDTDTVKQSITMNGTIYARRQSGDASAGHSSDGYLYSTFARGTCFLFETDFATVAAGILPDNARDLSRHDMEDIESHLLAIMKSVQIKP
jgi:hypothetical protein